MDNNQNNFSPVEQQIDELLQKSVIYLQTYRSIEALQLLDIAKKQISHNEVRWQIKTAVYSNIGNAYIQMGKPDNGISHFIQAYEYAEDGNNKAALAGTIANYYYKTGNNKQALEYADLILKTATEPELKASCFQIKGVVASSEENYHKAIELFNKAIELDEQAHCLSEMAINIMSISTLYLRMGMPETSLSEIYRAERYVKECRNFDLFTRCAIRRAKILFCMNRNEEAKSLIMALDDQQI